MVRYLPRYLLAIRENTGRFPFLGTYYTTESVLGREKDGTQFVLTTYETWS